MTLASSSRLQIRYIQEAAFGTTPTSDTNYPTKAKKLRVTSSKLDYSLQSEISKEIRADRMTTDNILTGAQCQGGVDFELSYGEFDQMFEGTLQSTWTAIGTDGVATITGTFTTTTLTASTGTPFSTMVAGQNFKIANAVNAQNNGYFKVVSIGGSGASITCATATFTAEVATVGLAISSARLKNSNVQKGFTIEEEYNDITQFIAYRGMTPSKMSLKFASKNIVTGMFDFIGKDAIGATSTQIPGAAALSSLTYDVMNAVSGVGNILENGSALTGTFIKSVSLEIENGLRGQDAIGVLGNAGIGSGTLKISGTLEIYFADRTFFDKAVNNTASSLSLRCVDGAGNGYQFTIPKLKYKDSKFDATGLDQDVMMSMPFQGLMDPTTNAMILIDRFGAAVTL